MAEVNRTEHPATSEQLDRPGQLRPAGRVSTSRRRMMLLRTGGIAVVMAAALALLLVWHRGGPHRRDCYGSISRLVHWLDSYRAQHDGFPVVLVGLEQRLGRYSVEHYTYRFEGFGAPADLPDGTLVVYCRGTHKTAFSEPWRHIAVLHQGRIVVQWIPEQQFEKLEPTAPFLGWQ